MTSQRQQLTTENQTGKNFINGIKIMNIFGSFIILFYMKDAKGVIGGEESVFRERILNGIRKP